VNQPQERRRDPRFPIQQLAIVKYEDDGPRELRATTENASLGGAFVHAETTIADGSTVEVTLLLKSDGPLKLTRLRAVGRVVRVERLEAGRFGIAIKYEHPILQV
jgi:hypothetical protein